MLDIAIVTACSGGYGQYLDDWARSIIALKTKPAQVCIAHTASERDAVEAARALLREAGLRVVTVEADTENVGRLRNAAVGLSEAEWVQHLDCDDMAMPHMLCDVAKVADRADVVAMGYERCGDLAAGPKFKKRTYRDTQGQSTLDSTAPASGVSPFRRSFWERSPYREDMIGGWDTALWLGFAHLDARFVATKRPCFWYRQHADSIFNVRRKSKRRTALVGPKLQNLRAGFSGVTVAIPWRPDGGARDRALAWVLERFAALHPDYEVVLGSCPEGEPWNKGKAVADALTRATGLTLVMADADCALPSPALAEAVALVTSGEAPWVVPHTTVHRLDRESTASVIGGPPDSDGFGGGLIRPTYEGYAGGGFVVVDRGAYEGVGGIPDRFEGWGSEDEALAMVLDTLVGEHVRLPYDLWHLWHPAGKRQKDPRAQKNIQMLRAFRRAVGDPEAMWSVVHGAPVSVPATREQRRAEIRAERERARQRRLALSRSGPQRETTGLTYLDVQRIRQEAREREEAVA